MATTATTAGEPTRSSLTSVDSGSRPHESSHEAAIASWDPDDDDQRRIARSVVIDLSTAADRLPPSFRDEHPDIDWTGIRATRKFIAHDYDGTDDEVLWQAIAVQFPIIVQRLTGTGASG